MKTAVYNQKGDKVEDIELTSSIFDVEPKVGLLEAAVRTYLANHRGPVASTKDRSEVRGGGRKPWRQKGTGRARHGSIRSPIWTGGGVTFGPSADRNWSLKMNKRAYRKALFMALTDKAREGRLIVVDSLDIDKPKTSVLAKAIEGLLSKVEVSKRSLTLVLPGKDEQLEQAGSNITELDITTADSLNAYDVLRSHSVIVLKDALPIIEKTYLIEK